MKLTPSQEEAIVIAGIIFVILLLFAFAGGQDVATP